MKADGCGGFGIFVFFLCFVGRLTLSWFGGKVMILNDWISN